MDMSAYNPSMHRLVRGQRSPRRAQRRRGEDSLSPSLIPLLPPASGFKLHTPTSSPSSEPRINERAGSRAQGVRRGDHRARWYGNRDGEHSRCLPVVTRFRWVVGGSAYNARGADSGSGVRVGRVKIK